MRTPDVGHWGRRVGENVRALRVRNRLSYRDLEVKLREYGQPIVASGLLKIERGERRVDVDELVALAQVLGPVPVLGLLARTVPDPVPPAEAPRRLPPSYREYLQIARAVVDDTLTPFDPQAREEVQAVLGRLEMKLRQVLAERDGADDGQR